MTMTRRILAGTVDVSVVIRIIDSTDGTPETGVVFNTSGIDLEYRRELAASVDITEATLAALTTAHADGGFLHIGNGYYRLDLPDAACAAGATGVLVHGTVTGMVVIGTYIELVAYNPYDGIRLGLTALPNAAADAAGGLPISDAGGLDLDSKLANTNEITVARMGALTDWINGGRLDLILDDILLDTGTTLDDLIDDLESRLGIPSNLGSGATIAANLVDIEGQTDDIGAAGAGLTAIPWNATWDTEVQSEVDDAIVARNLDKLVIVSGTADSGSTTTMVDAARTEIDADYWKGRLLLFTSGNISGQCAIITDFVVATDTFTFAPPLTQAVGTQNYVILPGISAWDDTLAEHLISGSTGAALNAAGSAGDPWSTALPGAYGAGSAGNILGNNLNTTISSRSSHSAADVWASVTRTLTAFSFSVTVGTNNDKTGYALSTAGIQAVWDALTSALTTISSIGKLLVDNINATISSRSSQTSVDTIDDFVDDLEGRLTSTRAGYLDNLSAGPVALQSSVDSLEAGVTVTTNNDKTGYRLSATGVDDIFDELRAGHSIAGSYGESFFTLESGAAVAGTLSTTQMSTDLTETTNDHYIGRIIIWLSGALLRQATDITDYDGTTKILTYTATTEAPTAADKFIIV